MENQPSTLTSYAQKMVQPSIGLFGILKIAFKTSARNGRILFFITTIMLSYCTAMEFANTFIFVPIKNDFDAHAWLLANAPFIDADPIVKEAFLTDFSHAVTYLFSYLCFLCLVLALLVTATVHSSFEAHAGKVLSLKEVFLGIRGRWKRALKTSIWMGIISLAIAGIFFLGSVLVSIMAEGYVSTALNWGMAIFATSLCSLWMVGLAVSVIEEGFSGLKAISEANEVRKGKMWQGFVLMGIMLLANCAAFGFRVKLLPMNLNITMVSGAENEKMAMAVGLAMSVPQNLVYCVWMLFVFAVFTVYYHECKQRKMEEETRALYAPLAVAHF